MLKWYKWTSPENMNEVWKLAKKRLKRLKMRNNSRDLCSNQSQADQVIQARIKSESSVATYHLTRDSKFHSLRLFNLGQRKLASLAIIGTQHWSTRISSVTFRKLITCHQKNSLKKLQSYSTRNPAKVYNSASKMAYFQINQERSRNSSFKKI